MPLNCQNAIILTTIKVYNFVFHQSNRFFTSTLSDSFSSVLYIHHTHRSRTLRMTSRNLWNIRGRLIKTKNTIWRMTIVIIIYHFFFFEILANILRHVTGIRDWAFLEEKIECHQDNWLTGVPTVAQWKWIWLISMRMLVWSLASLSESGICHCHESCGVGCRHSLDPMLLWLWCRLAAVVLIRHLTWELPSAMGVAS